VRIFIRILPYTFVYFFHFFSSMCIISHHSLLGSLSLRLICDYLMRFDNSSSDAVHLSRKCYVFLNDQTAVDALDKLRLSSLKTESNEIAEKSISIDDWAFPREKCPYCGVDILIGNLQRPKCKNGHLYIRCALTLQACKFKTYRWCIGCERKVASKNTSGELSVESILLNVDVCPFCGCRFVECHR